jgi:hypothetical protein
MNADVYQVVGNHYQKAYQHWTLVINCDLDYLAGNSTKYVVRWRKKDSLNDLHKALHYLNKLEESRDKPLARLMSFEEIVCEVNTFSDVNKLSVLERSFVCMLSTWQTRDELKMAREILFLLFDEAEALDKGAVSKPLTEENLYS